MDNTNDNNTMNPSEKTQLDPCACRRKGAKLEVYDWLSDIPESHDDTNLVEVRFKIPEKDITVIQLISNLLPAIWSLSRLRPVMILVRLLSPGVWS